ncbi:MAG: ABC transporter permease [Balneolaceae bacterium]
MIKNYLKIAWRNLNKNKLDTAISIGGLSIAIACCIGMLLFVEDELSFDHFHDNTENLYRLNKIVTPQQGGQEYHAITSGMMGPTFVEDYPEVKQAVRILPWFAPILTKKDQTSIMLEDVVFADDNFFEVFNFELLRGNSESVLEAPFSIVLTEETANRLFGDEDPIGQTVTGLNDFDYEVTGIAKNPPRHSHLKFNALVSWSTTVPGNGGLNFLWMNNWLTQVHLTYLLLEESANAEMLESKFPDFMKRHFPERADQYQLYLQPFSDIYLGSANLLHTRNTRIGNRTYVYVFSIIAGVILLIACINLMNLSTARATERIREVGIRKVMGAEPKQLIFQFLGESFLIVLLSSAIAVAIIQPLLPWLNTFTGKAMHLSLSGNISILVLLAAIGVTATLLSGLYPAFILSKFKPSNAFRPTQFLLGRFALRQTLVTVQYAATIALLVGTAVVYQQLQFTQSKDLGFNQEQLLTLPIEGTNIADNFDVFKRSLLQHPNILNATGASHIPGHGTIAFTILPEGKPENESWTANIMRLDDYDLVETFDMEIVSGRFFDEDRSTDAETGIVINETLANTLGWEDPVGKRMDIEGELEGGRIIGVVRDFHYESMHQEIAPLAMQIAPRYTLLTIKFSTSDVPGMLSYIEEQWKAHEMNYPFDYNFLDQSWASLYQSEQKLMKILSFLAALAIIIASFGLFGITSFMAKKRAKEIGIRKVMGASVANIVALLSKDFVKLVILGFVIAIPIAWYAMSQWLADFAYRIEIGPGIFALAGGTALVIALLTVSWQSIKAAVANPVESLRSE